MSASAYATAITDMFIDKCTSLASLDTTTWALRLPDCRERTYLFGLAVAKHRFLAAQQGLAAILEESVVTLKKHVSTVELSPNSEDGAAQPKSLEILALEPPKGIPSYACSQCDKLLLSEASRDAHELTHTVAKGWKCPVQACGATFGTNGSLTRHLNRTHGLQGHVRRRYLPFTQEEDEFLLSALSKYGESATTYRYCSSLRPARTFKHWRRRISVLRSKNDVRTEQTFTARENIPVFSDQPAHESSGDDSNVYIPPMSENSNRNTAAVGQALIAPSTSEALQTVSSRSVLPNNDSDDGYRTPSTEDEEEGATSQVTIPAANSDVASHELHVNPGSAGDRLVERVPPSGSLSPRSRKKWKHNDIAKSLYHQKKSEIMTLREDIQGLLLKAHQLCIPAQQLNPDDVFDPGNYSTNWKMKTAHRFHLKQHREKILAALSSTERQSRLRLLQ